MLAVGYARVSTEEQAQTGTSLDVQEEKIGASCVARDLQLTRIIQDKGFSAKNLQRPGIQEIIAGCKRRELDTGRNYQAGQDYKGSQRPRIPYRCL